jgi:hypothetical protein
MSDHLQRTGRPTGPRPTAKQQAYLRRLALARGISFTPPATRADASRLIDELKRRRPDSTADIRRERKQVSADMDRLGGATRFRDDEVEGYGSSATWKHS